MKEVFTRGPRHSCNGLMQRNGNGPVTLATV